MKQQYPYSNNKDFLSKISNSHIKEQWVKITLLEYKDEQPIKNIEGKIINGTITKNGDSAVRHICNLTCAIDTFKYNPESVKSDYSISKKIYLELGVSNNTDEYTNEKIIWFPQGVFFITSFAIAASATGAATVNLQFKDKMAQLDGTVGGILPATVRFDTITTVTDNTIAKSKALVYDIIMETVNHFGNENISNIIIDDIPTKAKRIIRWMGTESLWIYPIVDSNNNDKISYDVCFTSDLDEKQTAHKPIRQADGSYLGAKEYKTNQDIGYIYEDFVYDEELTFNAGSKVTDVLDKIKNWLGNYEYFYDEYGQFHFQEIKNYLNNSQSAFIWDKVQGTTDLDYFYESTRGKSVYIFDDNINLVSITNTPSYENIKNDFIVEGTVNNNGVEHVCRYHLVIDEKPTVTTSGYDNILVYTDPITNNTTITRPKIVEPTQINNKLVWKLPESAEDGKIYGLLDEPQTLTYQTSLKGINSFTTYYTNFANEENSLIDNEQGFINSENWNNQNSQLNEIANYLSSLLETYMGYIDRTAYKEKYRDIIFTLAKQLSRYPISSKWTPQATTKEYYTSLYAQYKSDIETYGVNIKDRISWCGNLLKLLYTFFNDESIIFENEYNDYVNENDWYNINLKIENLWANQPMSLEEDSDALRLWRKNRCLNHINILKVKQKQFKILSEQYTQIINEYNTKISLENDDNKKQILENHKTIIERHINNFSDQQKICDKMLTVLYATLTNMRASDPTMGDIYYFIDVNINVNQTSFWYYNKDKDDNKGYGWNEIKWSKYYNVDNNIGPMAYVDYININWGNINNPNDYTPSMNCHSLWYQNCYIDYAKEYDLSYFDTSKDSDSYIPLDWRTELLLMGLRAEENGTDPGYYYQELKANWPTIYDLENKKLSVSSIDSLNHYVGKNGVITSTGFSFYDDSESYFNYNINDAENTDDIKSIAKFKADQEAKIQDCSLNYDNDYYYYFFDMIDSSSSTWGEYSVGNIGRRTNVNRKQGVNCIFAPKIPNYAFINISGLSPNERAEAYKELSNISEEIIQVTDTFYNNFATGNFKYSAYEQIKYDLQQYTSYQNLVSITAIPCFYLEPNTRVTLNDRSTNTFGDYIIKSISIPLGAGSNMSVSLSKAMEKF